MSRRPAALVAATLALVLTAGTSLAASFPGRIDLPDGWQPEGITAGRGTTAYVGSLATGAIATVDVRTGALDVLVRSATGPAVGVDYEAGRDRLWVAGGPSSE